MSYPYPIPHYDWDDVPGYEDRHKESDMDEKKKDPETPETEHVMSLGYTIDDDGIWLSCNCGYRVNLGFDAGPADALKAEFEHRIQAMKVDVLKRMQEATPGWAAQTDWAELARELRDGDVEALQKRLPSWLRPKDDESSG